MAKDKRSGHKVVHRDYQLRREKGANQAFMMDHKGFFIALRPWHNYCTR